MGTYPQANRIAQWFSTKYSSAVINPNCVVWHSTETPGWPGYEGGAKAPNYTVKPNIAAKTVSWHAHFEDEESSRALVNLSGGVETNTANAIQVEMIGTCDPKHRKSWNGEGRYLAGRDYLYLPDAPDWYLNAIADFVAYCYRKHGILVTSGLKWNAYPDSYGATADRMTFAEWRQFVGHCGHQHVPENAHGDPGNFPMSTVLGVARAYVNPTTPPKEENEMQAADTFTIKNASTGASETARADTLLVRAGYAYSAVTQVLGPALNALAKSQQAIAEALRADQAGETERVRQILAEGVNVSFDFPVKADGAP